MKVNFSEQRNTGTVLEVRDGICAWTGRGAGVDGTT
jgi:hypothetical protein